jgi:hypothetical protein
MFAISIGHSRTHLLQPVQSSCFVLTISLIPWYFPSVFCFTGPTRDYFTETPFWQYAGIRVTPGWQFQGGARKSAAANLHNVQILHKSGEISQEICEKAHLDRHKRNFYYIMDMKGYCMPRN